MINLSFVNLPNCFTSSLQINMNSRRASYEELDITLSQNAGLLATIQSFYHDIDSQGRIYRIVANIGWENFRNQVSAMIIYRKKNNHYPTNYNASTITSILNFEDRLKNYSVSGYSRVFLLGFYFLMNDENLSSSNINKMMKLSDNLINLLTLTRAKTIKMDWLILTLMHYEHFFDPLELNDLIKAGVRYSDLNDELSDDQKLLMMKNFLSYGSSIGDKDIFLEKRL